MSVHHLRAPTVLSFVAAALIASASGVPVNAQTGDGGWTVPAIPAAGPIGEAEFRARRSALAGQMGDGMLFVMGGESAAAGHGFSQSPNFRYLTGVTEPGAALLITRQGSTWNEILFVLPADPAQEVWEGARLGVAGASALTGMQARPSSALQAALDSALTAASTLYRLGQAPSGEDLLDNLSPDQQVIARLSSRKSGLRVQSLGAAIQALRARKSPAELDRIRRAVHITALAQREAMRAIEPGKNEFEIEALIEYTFRRNGAERPGFATIVGSGENSTTLHYTRNDRFFEPTDVVVMDIGASYDGYTADVTRTVPVAGTFSAEQRAVYEVVLAAQKAAEARARPGATWQDLSAAADSVLAAGLTRLGLIDSPRATFRAGEGEMPQLRLYYMHGLGHGIGLQVHDPELSYSGPFQPGSAFTIEPGIYVRADALEHLSDNPQNRAMVERLQPAVSRFAGIGVRIEDDYLITPAGVERISAGAPREIAEIEALMQGSDTGPGGRQGSVVEWYRSILPR